MPAWSSAQPRVYLDFNATAPLRPEIRSVVEPLLFGDATDGRYGNASSVHWAGQAARATLEEARTRLANAIGKAPHEIIFTSGGTEADNLAMLGHVLHPSVEPKRVVLSAVEHPAVTAAAEVLADRGVTVEFFGVDERGRVRFEDLEALLKTPTALVALMSVNNETGIVHDVDRAAALCRRAGARLFVDAVQSVGKLPFPAEADLVAISGHKLGGLKGAGCLVRSRDVVLASHLVGGPQERGLRAGTEDVAAIVSLSEAVVLAEERREAEMARLGRLRERFETALVRLPGVQIVGDQAARVPNTTTAVFQDVDGDALLQAMDLAGIAVSSGSACSSGSLEPSPVLLALGFDPEDARSAVRFSTGEPTRAEDLDFVIDVLPSLLEQVRNAV